MQSLLKFIQKYSNFLIFIILEVVAFLLLTSYNEYPKSSVLSTSNAIVAFSYKVADNVTSYFRLRSVNEQLQAENAELRSQLAEFQNLAEDSVEENAYHYAHLDYGCIPAKVIQLSTNKQHNFLTINKGRRDSLYQGMGVRNSEGVVGIVTNVSERFAVVIPIINTNSRISAKFLKNGYYGTVEWDGFDYRYAKLTDVASHLSVAVGDTIVTSGLSPVFPENIPLAIVESAVLHEGDSYYTIKVRLQTDFRKLNYVQLIDNHAFTEEKSLSGHAD